MSIDTNIQTFRIRDGRYDSMLLISLYMNVMIHFCEYYQDCQAFLTPLLFTLSDRSSAATTNR